MLDSLITSIINEDESSKDIFHKYLIEKNQLLLERNITNQEDINALIKDLQQNATNPNVKKWLERTFQKHIKRNHQDVSPYQPKESDPEWAKTNDPLIVSFSPQFKSEAREVVDYLNTIQGSINMNYEQAKSNMERYQEQRRRQAEKQLDKDETKKKADLAASGTEVVKEYNSGMKWVNLTTPEALKYESHVMNHCVGDEEQGYISGVKSGRLHILSLRDRQNMPHVTIEIVKPNKIQQIKGKSNSGVKPEYVKYVKDILKNGVIGIKFGEIEDLLNVGILEQDGIWYDVYRLPGGFKVKGSLDLYNAPIEYLPDNLEVDGCLNLRGTKITSLPDNLKVRGNLNLGDTQITSLPDNLEVGGTLDLGDAEITSLPDNLKVGESLFLSGTKITSLPDNLEVGGSLYLSGTQITSLPDNLEVRGNLYLSGTEITSLPDNLKVGGSLNLRGTQITSLPDNLEVSGDLYLIGTKITSLPDNLEVGESLYLRGIQITSLPDNLEVGGSLDLRGTQITSLPDNLKISKKIFISSDMNDKFDPGKHEDKIKVR